MGRHKEKDSISCTFRLNADLVRKLHNFAETSRISNTAIVELSLEQFFASNIPTLAKTTELHK